MPKSVLIVEDDAATLYLYSRILRERGYRVIAAANGAEGVHRARQDRPSLILMDLRMPVLDGYSAMRYLRSFRETQGIPVCAISAYLPEEDERSRAEDMDFDGYLIKPIEEDQLLAEVERRIGPPPPVPHDPIAPPDPAR